VVGCQVWEVVSSLKPDIPTKLRKEKRQVDAKHFRGVLKEALMVSMVLGAGALAQAQQAEEKPDGGPVIQIGRPDAGEQPPQVPPAGPRPEAPKHWIGLLFGEIGPDSALRAQLDLPEGQGLLIDRVMPNSPAEKAGLKRHDILLRANDKELRNKQDLVELVTVEGEKGGQIALEVLRRGHRETVYVTPEERPAEAMMPPMPFGGEFGPPAGMPFAQDPLREFGPEGFEFRHFGPGVILGGGRGLGLPNMPRGVSISVMKEGDQPPRITVKRGEETWEVVGDDPKSLEQLPPDLRPLVENMLHGGPRIDLRGIVPGPQPEFGDGRLRERLEKMERRIQELQERLFGQEKRAGEKPSEESTK